MSKNKFANIFICFPQKCFSINIVYKIIILTIFFFISLIFIINIKLEKDISENLKSITLVQKDVIEYYIAEESGKIMRNINVLKHNPNIELKKYLKLACVYDDDILNYVILDKNKNLLENINNINTNYKDYDLSFLNNSSTENVAISPIFYDTYEKRTLMCIGGGIYNNDRSIRYYLIAILTPTLLNKSIQQDNKLDKVNFYLLDKSKIIYSSEKLNLKAMDSEYKNLIYNLDTKFSSRIIERAVPYTNSEKKQVYGYMISIDDTDWKIVYEQDKKYAIYSRYKNIATVAINNLLDFIKNIIQYIGNV